MQEFLDHATLRLESRYGLTGALWSGVERGIAAAVGEVR